MAWLGRQDSPLLIPSLSSRPIHSPSSRQIAHESPQFPVFVFKGLRTLPSSVSRKSCVCRSYENCRVTSFKLKVFLSPRRALSSLFSFFAPRTFHNSSLFKKICTLSKNSPGVHRQFPMWSLSPPRQPSSSFFLFMHLRIANFRTPLF